MNAEEGRQADLILSLTFCGGSKEVFSTGALGSAVQSNQILSDRVATMPLPESSLVDATLSDKILQVRPTRTSLP